MAIAQGRNSEAVLLGKAALCTRLHNIAGKLLSLICSNRSNLLHVFGHNRAVFRKRYGEIAAFKRGFRRHTAVSSRVFCLPARAIGRNSGLLYGFGRPLLFFQCGRRGSILLNFTARQAIFGSRRAHAFRKGAVVLRQKLQTGIGLGANVVVVNAVDSANHAGQNHRNGQHGHTYELDA